MSGLLLLARAMMTIKTDFTWRVQVAGALTPERELFGTDSGPNTRRTCRWGLPDPDMDA
jgi:hypothetical protein